MKCVSNREQKYKWAPGYYSRKCEICHEEFTGDKRATQCADCAYHPAMELAQGLKAENETLKAKLSECQKGDGKPVPVHDYLEIPSRKDCEITSVNTVDGHAAFVIDLQNGEILISLMGKDSASTWMVRADEAHALYKALKVLENVDAPEN